MIIEGIDDLRCNSGKN